MAGKTKLDKAAIFRRFTEGGESMDQIADSLGIDRTTVRYHLVRMGAYDPKKNRERHDFTEDELRQLREDYPRLGAKAMAERFGCREKTVIVKASKMGLKVNPDVKAAQARARGQAQALLNTSANLAFFDSWNPTMAYVLGYFWADGNIQEDGVTGYPAMLNFICTQKDGDYLRQVADAMGFAGEFRTHPARDWAKLEPGWGWKLRHSKAAVRFTIHSTVLAAKLVNDHGLAPRKSTLDLPFPDNVPDEYLSHFARGNLDGDGSIGVRSGNRNRATFVWNGSHQFIRGLTHAIHRIAGTTPPSVSKGDGYLTRASWNAKADIVRLCDWLYKDATLWLPRKREKAEEAKRVLANVKGYTRRRRNDGTVVTFA